MTGIERGPADFALLGFDDVTELFSDVVEHLHACGNDFRTDAIARQNRQFHFHFLYLKDSFHQSTQA